MASASRFDASMIQWRIVLAGCSHGSGGLLARRTPISSALPQHGGSSRFTTAGASISTFGTRVQTLPLPFLLPCSQLRCTPLTCPRLLYAAPHVGPPGVPTPARQWCVGGFILPCNRVSPRRMRSMGRGRGRGRSPTIDVLGGRTASEARSDTARTWFGIRVGSV